MKLPVDRALAVGIVTATIDLGTKRLAFGDGETERASKLFPGVEIDPTRNDGIAFSLLQGRTVLIFALMVTAITMLVVFYLRHRDKPGLWIATGLMLGGAAGNAIDRVTLGYVRDFVAIGSFPTFNVADMALACGVVVLLISQWMAAEQPPADQMAGDQGPEQDEAAHRDLA